MRKVPLSGAPSCRGSEGCGHDLTSPPLALLLLPLPPLPAPVPPPPYLAASESKKLLAAAARCSLQK